MTTEEGRKHSPPYVSYKTFESFMTKLQQQLPTRIDRSYLGRNVLRKHWNTIDVRNAVFESD